MKLLRFVALAVMGLSVMALLYEAAQEVVNTQRQFLALTFFFVGATLRSYCNEQIKK